jgi:hypothetical protein
LRAWIVIAGVAAAAVIAAAAFLVLASEPSTIASFGDALRADAHGSCPHVATQRVPARDDDDSGFQARADISTIISCGQSGAVAQVIEFGSRDAVLGALKRRPRSTIYRGEKVCVLDTSLVFASFRHSDALGHECTKLGGHMQPPASKP